MNGNSQFRTSNIQDVLVAVWAGEPTTARTGIPNKAARDLMAKQFESMT